MTGVGLDRKWSRPRIQPQKMPNAGVARMEWERYRRLIGQPAGRRVIGHLEHETLGGLQRAVAVPIPPPRHPAPRRLDCAWVASDVAGAVRASSLQ